MILQSQKSALLTPDREKSLKKARTIVTLVLVISVGVGEGVEDECGGPLSDTPFPCFMDAIDYFDRCTFPTAKLNADCMLSSCPGLNGTSPINRDGTVNRTTLNGLITVLNECLATKPTICGIKVASIPMVQLGWTLDQLLPSYLSINGSCVLKEGAVNNLDQAVFSVPAEQKSAGPVSLTFAATNITQTTTWNCSMSISTALLAPLRPGRIELYNFPEMKGLINITVNPRLALDLSPDRPLSFSVRYDNSSINLRSYNYVSCALNLPPVLVDLLNLSLNKFFKASETTAYATNFLSTFATQGVAAAVQSCR